MRKLIILFQLLFVATLFATAQSNTLKISGTVLDDTGPIVGASVYLKDRPGVGNLTRDGGKFSISASKGDVIIFSYIGFLKTEYLVTKEENKLSIVLKVNDAQLGEIVVEAFGQAKRKVTSTGAITSVDVKTLQTPATSLANMLGARVPGVIALQSSGEPGKNISEFWIRGIGTFGANASALVLIDGLEGSLNNVDPADVESFSVLKDASATAMYGVRGANGVVLVTTKRGLSEKLKLDFRANAAVSRLDRMPNYLRAYEYAKLANEASAVRNGDLLYNDTELDIIKYGLDKDFYPDVNWQDEILKRTSLQQTYYASARGGGSVARYFFSLNTSQESAIYKQDASSKYFNNVGYNTYGFRANIDMNLTPSTRVYFGTDGNFTQNNLPGSADTYLLWSAQSRLTPLTIPLIYSDGRLPSYNGVADGASPYILLNYTGSKKLEAFNGTYTLNLEQDLSSLLKRLKFNVQGAYTNNKRFEETRYIIPELWHLDKILLNGNLAGTRQAYRQTTRYNSGQDQYRKYFLQSNINYGITLSSKHNLSFLAHYEMSDIKTASQGLADGVGIAAIPLRYQGLAGRLSYDYDNIYLFDANFGYTGSENFQPGRRFGFFPSVSAGWVPTGYNWVKSNMEWLEYFKIRASYGIVGNDRISNKRFPYRTQINVNAAGGWGYLQNAYAESSIGADNLEWEKAKKFDLGIEAKFLKKFDFTVDFFSDYRDGIFQQRQQVPDYIGLINMPFGNVGSMKSFGADGNISYAQQLKKDMSFVLRGNFTIAKNKVNYFEEADTKYPYFATSGRPLGYQRGYLALGLFKDQYDISTSPIQTFGTYMPGDIKYKDVNGDGLINTDDIVPLAYSNYPRLMYGFGGEFTYRKLTVGFLFKGTGDVDYFRVNTGSSNNMGYVPFYEGELGNVLTLAADPSKRWIPKDYADPSIPENLRENPNAQFPRLSYGNNTNNAQTSNFWIANSRYLRLQEVNISYKLVIPALKSIGLSAIDLSLVGTNLFVWDTVKLWDPEQAAANGKAYPIPQRFIFQTYIRF